MSKFRDKAEDFEVFLKALKKIANMPGESIWRDDRDDAANIMVRIAERALEGEFEEDKE